MYELIFFLRIFSWFSLRTMKKHKGRCLAVFLGVALGASVFSSVRLSVNASLSAFTRSMDLVAGQADRVVVRPGGRVPDALVAPLLRDPAVQSASPILTVYVKSDRRDAEPFLLLGIDPILDRPIRSWWIDAANQKDIALWAGLLNIAGSLVLAEPLAQKMGLAAGDRVTLEHMRRKSDFLVLGFLEPHGVARFEGGRIGIVDIATIQEFTGNYGETDRIDLLLNSDATEDLRRLQAILPHGILLKPPAESKESGRRLIQAYQINLSILSFVSLFVGMFLVYSLISLNAASRRREIAILLSAGAAPRMIFFIFLFEGAVFGIIGWLLAVPITSFFVKYMLHGVSRTISTLFVRIPLEALTVSAWELFLSFIVTTGVSVTAAFHPAWQAMRVSPKEALSASPDRKTDRNTTVLQLRAGFCFILLAWPLSKLPGPAGFPVAGYLAILLAIAGFSLMAPWLLHHAGGRPALMIRRIAGEPAFLASRYIRDSGGRTAISVGALVTAVALFTSLVIMIYSFRQTVELWVHHAISGDFFLRPKMAEYNQYRDILPAESIEALGKLKTPVDIETSRRFYLTYGKDPYQFEAADLDVFFRYGDFLFVRGVSEKIRPKLLAGDGVVVSEVFANRTGLTAGDRFQAFIGSVYWDLPILAVIRDYRTDGGVVFYSVRHFMKKSIDKGINGVRFFFKEKPPDPVPAVARLSAEIIQLLGDSVELYSGAALRQDILKIFDETFAVTTVLLVIALVVAALGITTTLTVLVLERSRQLSTLYAVGASFSQIRAMIFWEAAFMVVAGEIFGLTCGFFMSYLLVFVIHKESFGWTFHYGIDWWMLCFSLPLIFLAALLAALPAARAVLRTSPATVLKE